MSDSLSKKFISDEEILRLLPDILKNYLGYVRACIDKALEKAGVTERFIQGCFADGSFERGEYCAAPIRHARAILYIQPAPKVKSAEEKIEEAMEILKPLMLGDRHPCPCSFCTIAAKLRG